MGTTGVTATLPELADGDTGARAHPPPRGVPDGDAMDYQVDTRAVAPVVTGPEAQRYVAAALAMPQGASAEDDYDAYEAPGDGMPPPHAHVPLAADEVHDDVEDVQAEADAGGLVNVTLPAWALEAVGGPPPVVAEVRFARPAEWSAGAQRDVDEMSVSSEEATDDDLDDGPLPVRRAIHAVVRPQPDGAAGQGSKQLEAAEKPPAGRHEAAAFSLVHQTSWEEDVNWADDEGGRTTRGRQQVGELDAAGDGEGCPGILQLADRHTVLALPAPSGAASQRLLPAMASTQDAGAAAAKTVTSHGEALWGVYDPTDGAAPPPPPAPPAAPDLPPAKLTRMLPWRNAALWQRSEEGFAGPILWEGTPANDALQPASRPVPLLLDLNDPEMTFAMLPARQDKGAVDLQAKYGIGNSAATVLPPALAKYAPPRRRAGAVAGAAGGMELVAKRGSGDGAAVNVDARALLAPLNVSLDDVYAARGNDAVVMHRNALQRPLPLPVAHALPALKLETAPSYLSPEDARHWHSPRARLVPSHVLSTAPGGVVPAARGSGWCMSVYVVTLRDDTNTELHLDVDPDAPVSALCADIAARWPEHAAYRAVQPAHQHQHHQPPPLPQSQEEPLKWPFRLFPAKKREDDPFPAALDPDKSLADQSCAQEGRALILVATRLVALPNRLSGAVPGPDRPRAPPAAFQSVEDLSLRDGHLWVVEYSEQHPLLMSNPAMGARRVCWYRKTGPDDAVPPRVLAAAGGADVQVLEPQGASPFLGDIAPGAHLMCMETRMSRSPIWEHKPLSSDFIVARTRTGALLLRGATRTAVVGHIEPHEPLGRVPAPKQNEVQGFQERRMKHAIFQKLRALRAAGEEEVINIEDLKEEFPYHGWEVKVGTGLVNNGSALVKSVKTLIRSDKPGSKNWYLLPGIDIPSEESLRQLVTPEAVCCYESMQAGRERLQEMGIMGVGLVNPKTNMMTAVAQLPRTTENRTNCALIALELSLMPWCQTNTFLDMLAGRATMRLDSSRQAVARRGQVFHYVRKTQRHPADMDERRAQAIASQPKRITGTEADLRKLGLVDCSLELKKFGLTDKEIDPLTRWQRVGLIRDLSAAAVQDGGRLRVTQSKWVRVEREGAKAVQRTQKETATQLLGRMARMYSISEEGVEEEEGAPAGEVDADTMGDDQGDDGEPAPAPAPAAPPVASDQGAAVDDDEDSDLDSDEEDYARELEAAMLLQAHAGTAKAAAARLAAEEAAMAEEAEERRNAAELHGLLFENGVAADGEAAPAAPLPPPPPGSEGKTLQLRRKLIICHPGGRIEEQESVITDAAVIAAYMRAKTSGGDTVKAVLEAQGPAGALPYALKGSFVQSKKRYMRPELKERRDREKVKRALRRTLAVQAQYEQMKTKGLDAAVILAGTTGNGGVFMAKDDSQMKLSYLVNVGKALAQGLKAKVVKPSRLKNRTGVFDDYHIPRGKPGRKPKGQRRGDTVEVEDEAEYEDEEEEELPAEVKLESDDDGGAPKGGKRKREGGAGGGASKRHVRGDEVERARQEGRTADVALYGINSVLLDALDTVTQGGDFDDLRLPISDKRNGVSFCIEDYSAYVPKALVMSTSQIRSRCNAVTLGKLYPSVDAFLADVERIATNARAYHLPGPDGRPPGLHATPSVADLAAEFVERVKEEVDARRGELEALAAQTQPQWVASDGGAAALTGPDETADDAGLGEQEALARGTAAELGYADPVTDM